MTPTPTAAGALDDTAPTPPTADSPAAAEAPLPAAYARRWRILAIVLVAEVMDLLDSTVTNVAGPSVRDDLGGGASLLQWLASGYTLAFGVLLVVGGRLGDRWGRRRLFLLGAGGFAAASLLCALSPSPELLVTARIAQGAFGALLIPQGFGILKSVFPPGETGKAFAAFGPVLGLSAVGGPILAGALIHLDLFGTGWRLIFLMNVPLGLAAVLGGLRYIPRDDPNPGVRIDFAAAALLTAASTLIILPLIQGPEADWPLWSFGCLAAGIAAFAGFILRERRSPHSLIEATLLRNRAYKSGMLFGLAFFAGTTGFMLITSLFVQLHLHYGPLDAGLTLAPIAVGIVVASIAGFQVMTRLGRNLLLIGVGVHMAGLIALAAVVTHYGSDTTSIDLIGPLFIAGLGMGAVFAPLFDVILAGVAEHELGSASGSLSAMQQLAGALGAAGITTLFFQLGEHHSASTAMAVGALAVACLGLLAGGLVFLLPRHARPHEA
ncbi:MFS transporter [Embleya sp. NPDC005575]|uniref:MFS transporter n=1 Tax=Embleya sp. NPDC005575 TaxID=3156892 RepID=UPI0033BBFA74